MATDWFSDDSSKDTPSSSKERPSKAGSLIEHLINFVESVGLKNKFLDAQIEASKALTKAGSAENWLIEAELYEDFEVYYIAIKDLFKERYGIELPKSVLGQLIQIGFYIGKRNSSP